MLDPNDSKELKMFKLLNSQQILNGVQNNPYDKMDHSDECRYDKLLNNYA